MKLFSNHLYIYSPCVLCSTQCGGRNRYGVRMINWYRGQFFSLMRKVPHYIHAILPLLILVGERDNNCNNIFPLFIIPIE